MNERNKHTLDQAIKGLSTYSPPASAWKHIESELDQKEGSRETLGQAIQGLASYRAPEKVWDQIEDKLDARKKWMPMVWAAAAVILVLLLSIPFFPNGNEVIPEEQALEVKASNAIILNGDKIAELSANADSNEIQLWNCFQDNLPMSDSAKEAWDALQAIEQLRDSLEGRSNPIMKRAIEAARVQLIQEMLDAHCPN